MAIQGYKQFRCVISGDSLVMHNGQTADPLNPFSKAMKQISGKRKKTDADFEALADLEFRAGLYLDEQQRVIVPGRVIEAAIAMGAKKSKEGKQALSGLFVDTDAVLSYEGSPMSVDALVKSPTHRLAVPVRVSTSRIIRTRPHFKNWSAEFLCSVREDVANDRALKTWVEACGALVGLCDWRPRHGRFALDKFEEVKQPLKVAA